MTEGWTITPPTSPVKKKRNVDNFDDSSVDSFTVSNDWDVRLFCCMGEPHGNQVAYHENSYLSKKDLAIFDDEDTDMFFLNDFDSLHLFGFNFDKGSALVKDMSSLFKMAKQSYMQLENVAITNVDSFGMNTTNKKMGSYISGREEIVRFFIYLRNYVRRVGQCSKYKWMAEDVFTKLNEELKSFISLNGSITCIPDYIINYSANSAGNKCTQPSYHVFHCQLDIKWLHITLLYQLILYKQRLKNNTCSQDNDNSLTFEDLECVIRNLIFGLINISMKRFQHTSMNDLAVKTMFTCTCVRELWRLLQVCTDTLHSKQRSKPFWQYVNEICDEILGKSNAKEVQQKYTCSNPAAFILWILKHLGKLYKSDPQTDLKSNYFQLENCLKSSLNTDVPESEMRVLLCLVESIFNIGWEERTEPLVLCWEYFHKRLNSSFLMSSGSISGLAIVSKSALGLITNLNTKLDHQNSERNMDSFHMYLRLLGHKLRKWQDSPDSHRCWNQFKGRILSKFSAAKLSALTETGLYHFISLFLTLAITADMEEMGNKLQTFLKMLPVQEIDVGRMKLVWKTHMSLILLYAECNRDISVVASPLLDMVDVAVHQQENLDLMRIFAEGLQDLIDYTNNLELGQYMLLGNWIPQFLSRCTESDASRLLDSLLCLINKLNSIMCAQLPVSQDSQLILLHNALWECLVPHLKTASSNPSSPYQISDISAMLTILSMKSCFAPSVKTRAVDLFTFYIINEKIDVNILCRYLGQISRTVHLHNAFSNNYIILIKGWLKCLLLTCGNDAPNEDISSFTNYVITIPELQRLLSETSITITSQSDYFETFLTAVQLKHSSLQDFHLKNKFVNQILTYFSNVDRWLSFTVNSPKSAHSVMNVYQNVGLMFVKIPQVMYVKSKPNTLLQCFLELLLLPLQVRNPQFKLNAFVTEAIKKTLHLYVHGLFKLAPENDNYIARCVRELVTIYVPRLVRPKGTILTYGCTQVSLSKCFENSDCSEPMSIAIVEVVCNTFLKRRTKTPHQFAYQALTFFHNIISVFKNDNKVLKCFVQNAFERICDVYMFCDLTSPCRNEARDIIHLILNMNSIRNDADLGRDIMAAFGRLCHEHLAFTSRNLFDLFEDIVTVAPDLVYRFVPQLNEKVKEVENKRGVGYDRALRKGLERIEDALKNIRDNQSIGSFV